VHLGSDGPTNITEYADKYDDDSVVYKKGKRPCNWVKDSSFTRAPLQDNGRGFRLGHVWGISEYKDKMGTTARMSKEKAKY